MIVAYIRRSRRPGKKYDIIFANGTKISFGARGYSDFTIHKDVARRERYLARHIGAENWAFDGMLTPGFWARWLLWNKPSLAEAINDVRARFGIKVMPARA